MDDVYYSSATTGSPVHDRSHVKPDFTVIPPIAILPAHMTQDEERKLSSILSRYNAPLTIDICKAKVFVGKVGTKRRAEFEMRAKKIKVEEIIDKKRPASPSEEDTVHQKRRTGSSVTRSLATYGDTAAADDDSQTTIDQPDISTLGDADSQATVDEAETEDEGETDLDHAQSRASAVPEQLAEKAAIVPSIFSNPSGDDIVWVIKTDWINACITARDLLPLGDSLVLKAKVLERPSNRRASIKDAFARPTKVTVPSQHMVVKQPDVGQDILTRAKADAVLSSSSSRQPYRPGGQGPSRNRFLGKAFASQNQMPGIPKTQLAHLLQQTTSEYEGEDSDFPPPPEWVQKEIKYACQRFTPPNPPNEAFIEELKKIRKARILIDDEVGVRAYSTSIAAIAAYPYKFIHPRQILQLPGCDTKIASLWVELKNTGRIQAVSEFENDEAMKVLCLFYDIWGVGAKTARHFYYDRHWTELDDIIEFGWNDLDRVQQIGVKYYNEFLDGIPRPEVQQIASVVRTHVVRLRDERATVTIVGGYRRGKTRSGDVDMIVSHPDLSATADLITELVEALDEEGWITHTLLMSTNCTQRGQATLPFRTSREGAHPGFDTLDKALVVWQGIRWPTREVDLEKDPNAKNPNPHRRVDIIISPWRTVGCAVMGWSGGTTFQRDLRRYAKNVKRWKFDSSGVRSRMTGEVIALEGPHGIDGTPEDAERKVFEGLGLEFIPPEMRHTG